MIKTVVKSKIDGPIFKTMSCVNSLPLSIFDIYWFRKYDFEMYCLFINQSISLFVKKLRKKLTGVRYYAPKTI